MKKIGKKRNVEVLSIETYSCGCVGCESCNVGCAEKADKNINQEYAYGRHIYNMDWPNDIRP